jgi:hypothetical protein
VSFILFLIIAPVTRIGSRIISFRFTGTSRSTDLFYFKPSSIVFGKRSAGATFSAGDSDEFLKRSRKFANPFNYIYITSPRRLFCQRCARRYITIPDRNFSF